MDTAEEILRDHPEATNWYVWKGWAFDSTPVYCRIVSTPYRLYLEAQSRICQSTWYDLIPDCDYLIIETFRILEQRNLFVAELIGRLGLDREAIDREGLPVGNEILKALDEKLAEIQQLSALLRRCEERARTPKGI